MSQAARDSLLLLRWQQQQKQERMRGFAGGECGGVEGRDLFAQDRRGGSSSVHDGPPNLGRIAIGSTKLVKGGMDDLLSAADLGKHDYDWLLTPPGSPLSSVDTEESHLPMGHPSSRKNSSARSISTNRTSRLSAPQVGNYHSTRPSRSNSVTRPSVSTTYSSNLSNRTAILNTSTASVTSSRPSTPGSRSTTALSNNRQSSSTLSQPASRSSTPSKIRPTTNSAAFGSRPSTPTPRSQSSATPSSSSTVARPRPSTPTPRSQSSATSNSSGTASRPSSRPSTPTRRTNVQASVPAATSNSTSSSTIPHSRSRPSTPTRRAPTQISAPVPIHSQSAVRNLASNGRKSAPSSRHSSPARPRAPLQVPVPPDFPQDVPPNLRTKLPERPASAGRSRPGLPLTLRANLNPEPVPQMNANERRPSSPAVARGRLSDNSPKLRSQNNAHEISPAEMQKSILQENVARKPVRATSTMEGTGFGRTLSKMSLDMALRHMDIRQGVAGIRGASLFPQSIRSTASKIKPARKSDPVVPPSSNGTDTEDNSCNGMMSTSCSSAASENGEMEIRSLERMMFVGRTSDPDIYESSRYDALLLKEDVKNLNWLHSVEDKADQSPVFDLSFEPPPEPFDLQ